MKSNIFKTAVNVLKNSLVFPPVVVALAIKWDAVKWLFLLLEMVYQ